MERRPLLDQPAGQDREELPELAFLREDGPCPASCVLAHPDPRRGVVEEPSERGLERRLVAGRDEEPRLAVDDRLWDPARACGDDGDALRHRLERRTRERVLPDGRDDAEVGAGDERARALSVTGEQDVLLRVEPLPDRGELRQERAVAEVEEHGPGPRAGQVAWTRSKATSRWCTPFSGTARHEHATTGRSGAIPKLSRSRVLARASSGRRGTEFQILWIRERGTRLTSIWRRAT